MTKLSIKKFWLLALTAIWLLAYARPSNAQLNARDIAKRCSSFIVKIECGDSTGTGFIDECGLVWTAYHVVKPEYSESVLVKTQDGKNLNAERIATDESRDFAILRVSESIRGLSFGDYAAAELGEDVFVLGHPKGLPLAITQGIISAKNVRGDVSLLQTSASISPGSSGSPVINNRGEVLGLISFFFRDAQNVNYAIACNSLKIFGLIGNNLITEDKKNSTTDTTEASYELISRIRSKIIFDKNYNNIKNISIFINFIYACNGYRFKDSKIQTFFEKFPWYEAFSDDQEDIKKRMNNFELKNLEILTKNRDRLKKKQK